MADIVNLRTARKARARAEAEKQAADNRVRFGRTKAEKQTTRGETARAAKAHDAGRIAPADPKSGNHPGPKPDDA
jgi:hypothetical protein